MYCCTLQENKKMSNNKGEKYDISGAIRYIKFDGDYGKFDECKNKTKAI